MLARLNAVLRKIVAPFEWLFHFTFRSMYRLERYSLGLALAIIIAGGIGGAVEIAPLFTIDETVEDVPDMRLYTPLEQVGRDIYLREGCYTCHSQMIRTLRDEVDRWGPYSLAVESKYDHPMLWGSKRTGPDLARVGGKYSDAWHFAHLYYPRDVSPDSVMPAYRWLARRQADLSDLRERLATLRAVGVPYTDEQIENAVQDVFGQVDPNGERAAGLIERYGEATNIRNFDAQDGGPTEMDAMIAYLQVLGQLIDPETIAAAQAQVLEEE
jgi:cytochrome c oxidase cbb3-type subunit II